MSSASRRLFMASVVLAAAACGTVAAVVFARVGVTSSQYDTRGPLVVAGVALSVVSFAVATGSVSWIVSRVSDSEWAAAAAAFVLIINPNLLYLQSTPAIEPLLLGTTLLAVAMLVEWCVMDTADLKVRTTKSTSAGLVFALACVTRHEAWLVTGAALCGAVVTRRQQRGRLSEAIRDVAPIAMFPVVTIGAVLLFHRILVGYWFASEWFGADSPALWQPWSATIQILTGVRSLGGTLTTVIALVGLIGLLTRGVFSGTDALDLVALAPVAAAAGPWIAFIEGHPQRVRYMVPLLAAQAIGVGAAAARWRQAAPVAAIVLMIVAGLEIAPMFGAVPMFGVAQ